MQLPRQTSIPVAWAEPAALVYDLRLDGNSGEFYARCSRLADRVLAEAEIKAATPIAGFSRYLLEKMKESRRSEGEYALDFLLLGHLLQRYGNDASRTPMWAVQVARLTCRLQRRWEWTKPLAGLIRASVLSRFMTDSVCGEHNQSSATPSAPYEPISTLVSLIAWLGATGDFDAEVKRLIRWRTYLRSLAPAQREQALRTAIALYEWFACEAALELGDFTRGVEEFLATEHQRRGLREDWLFCSQGPAEYHLNMVAAEIMNRGMRAEFERAQRRVVLVPGCLRGELAASCRARGKGLDLKCSACNPACAVNRLTKRMRSLGATIYVVPHASSFARWLNRWQHEPETGVAAVACMLHILPGGLEMRARHMAAQCVPLDFPGCCRHWRRESTPTTLNEERLVQIVSAT